MVMLILLIKSLTMVLFACGQPWSFFVEHKAVRRAFFLLSGKEWRKMKNTIIKTSNLTKRYRRYKKKEGLYGSIAGLIRREYEEKTAVCQMDLSIGEGEFVGLIGANVPRYELKTAFII